MSFTTRIKNEISGMYDNPSANKAELSAILRNSFNIENNNLEIITENGTVCKHIYTLIKELYNINVKTEFKKLSSFSSYIIRDNHIWYPWNSSNTELRWCSSSR